MRHFQQPHRLVLEFSRRFVAIPNLGMLVIHGNQIANRHHLVVLKGDDDVADPGRLSDPDISQIARPQPTARTRNP